MNSMTTSSKIVLAVWCIGLVIGGATHVFDNLYFGFLPYGFAPLWLNLYWSALGIIDFIAVFLLLKHRTLGVWFTLVLMLSNVVINSVALYSLEVITEAWPLQFQTLFFGFCLGSVYLLLRHGRNKG